MDALRVDGSQIGITAEFKNETETSAERPTIS